MGRVMRVFSAGLAAAIALLAACSNPVLDVVAKQYDEAGGFEPLFSASETSFLYTSSVTYTNATVAEVESLQWDFGDGSTAQGSPVTHQYSEKGVYTVTLTATSKHGTVRTVTTTVYAMGTEPTVSISSPAKGSWVNAASASVTATLLDKFSKTDNANLIGVSSVTVTVTNADSGTDATATYTLSAAEKLLSQTTGFVYTYAWDTSSAADGSKTITIAATDGEETTPSSVSIAFDDTAPTATFVIDADATYATTTSVNLALTYGDGDPATSSGVTQMRFSNDNATWSAWETAAATRAWTLAGGTDGTRTVYAQVKDAAGNVTSASDQITLDAAAPTVSTFSTLEGSCVKSAAVTLTCAATDAGSSVAGMHFRNGSGTWSTYESYATSKSWNIGSGDGSYTIWAQFKDANGHESTPISLMIVLDTGVPSTPTFTIASAATGSTTWTNVASVTLTNISSSDTTSGLSKMCFSTDNATWSAWQSYASTASYTLAAGDTASSTVYLKVQDKAGNDSSSGSDTIGLDTAAPTVSTFVINGGDTYSSSTTVTLTISAVDATSSISQRFSNDNATWSSWEAYTTSRSWTIGSSGTATVYAQLRDAAGNTTSTSDTILWDSSAPSISGFTINSGAAITTVTGVTVAAWATDSTSMTWRLSNDGSTWGSWASFTSGSSRSWTLSSGDGSKTVYVQICDTGGNISTTNAAIILDANAPVVSSFRIGDGSGVITSVETTVSGTVNDVTGVTMYLSTDNSTWSWSRSVSSGSFSYSYSLPSVGPNTVYARFVDTAGNETTTQATVIVDNDYPLVTNFVINNDAAVATSRTVTVNALVSDQSSMTMYLSTNGTTWTTWGTYAASGFSYDFTADGSQILYARFVDLAGHSTTVSDSIVVDTAAPAVSLLLNGGSGSTTSSTVTASITVTDTTSVTVQLSNDGSSWTPEGTYTSGSHDIVWTLSAGPGSKTVYLQCTDEAGHISSTSATITYSPSYETVTWADVSATDASTPFASDPGSLSYGTVLFFRTVEGYYGEMYVMSADSVMLNFREKVWDFSGNLLHDKTVMANVGADAYVDLSAGAASSVPGMGDFQYMSTCFIETSGGSFFRYLN